MEMVSLVGVLLGIFAVFGGALLEGLHLSAILQPTAAVIVVGGTLGATLLSYTSEDLRRAVRLLGLVFRRQPGGAAETLDEIVTIANIARKEGILAVDGQRDAIRNELFKKTIKYVIDGFEPATVRDIMQAEIDLVLEEEEAAAKVWEGAGGYAPTIGIIGAVLGLIHVMGNLSDPSKLGDGIAVAFVATVYGVGMANLILIPLGTKLKRRAQMRALEKELVMLGVIGIQEGQNPLFLREKLEVYLDGSLRGKASPGASPQNPA